MSDTPEEKRNPLREVVQPFIDLARAPAALRWGIYPAYFLEGTVYFGVLNYLHMYFNQYAHLNDVWANLMVGVLTAGITLSMFLLGFVADWKGVRFALIAAFCLLILGRFVLATGPTVGLDAGDVHDLPLATQAATPVARGEEPAPVTLEAEAATQPPAPATTEPAPTLASLNVGLGSPLHLVAMLGILFILIGYGMYQPAAYAAVRQFTSGKTAGMAFAVLYGVMNLGIVVTAGFGPIRNAIGISGAYWVFIALTAGALLFTVFLLSPRSVRRATADAKAKREREKQAETPESSEEVPADAEQERPPQSAADERPSTWGGKIVDWAVNHPLTNAKFSFFIFCLIPVQTLFAHQWLTMPMYIKRAYAEGWPWISNYFELMLAINPLLIFLLAPTIAALTQKRKVYNMMIAGTFVMGAPTFLLALGPSPWTLVTYMVFMTVGEAMWQPRFLQYAAEIAPEGRTGVYMGVAQFPWFLTKVIVPLYNGWFLTQYCPEQGEINTEPMWLIYALIAMSSTVLLVMAKGWVGKDFKTKHEG